MESKGKKLLIADDEPDIIDLLEFVLKQEGYEVYTASNGQEALDKATEINPDLIILDENMPLKTGEETLTILRKKPMFNNTMIVFLTANSDENSIIKVLEKGADDYISKPTSYKVIVSRVNALFRRIVKTDEKNLLLGDLEIDPERYWVKVGGVEKVLAKKEFELLYLLASKPGRVFVRNEILNLVWGSDVVVGDRTIDVHIRKIRNKLGIDCVYTVKGVGYKFEIL